MDLAGPPWPTVNSVRLLAFTTFVDSVSDDRAEVRYERMLAEAQGLP